MEKEVLIMIDGICVSYTEYGEFSFNLPEEFNSNQFQNWYKKNSNQIKESRDYLKLKLQEFLRIENEESNK